MFMRCLVPVLLMACGTTAKPGVGLEPVDVCALPTGSSSLSLEVDGVPRSAVVRRGAKASGAAPLLFVWHGFGGTAERFVGAVRPETYWDDAIVVAPQGLGRTFEEFGDRERPGWQVEVGEHGDRDLALFDAVMAELRPCIDPDRVYSTGFSNGGFFSNLLGCVRGEVVDGIAPVGGGGRFPGECGPKVPALIIHGAQDEVVPFTMGEDAARHWAAHNGCPPAEPVQDGGCALYDCEADVRFCSFEGKHNWPGTAAAQVASFLRASES
jgi:polyhydroxybutyrate depolymerase